MNQEPTAPPPPPPPYPPSSAPPPPGRGGGGGARLPWEVRQDLGFVDALVGTVRLLITAPADAFSRLRADGDYLSPVLFGVVLSLAGQLFAQFWNLLFGNAWSSMLGESGYGGGAGIGSLILAMIVTPIVYVILLFIMSGIYHLLLMLLGSVEGSAFEGTLKVVAYSSVAGLGNVIPVVGALVALVGSVVLMAIGFQKVHHLDQVKATLAAVIPVVLCCLCAVGGALLFGATLAAALAGGAAAAGG